MIEVRKTVYFYPSSLSPDNDRLTDWMIHSTEGDPPEDAVVLAEHTFSIDPNQYTHDQLRGMAVEALEKELEKEMAQAEVRQANLKATIREFQALTYDPQGEDEVDEALRF